MSFSKRQGNDAVCYTKPLDSLKSWNDRFFWVDAFACPASFPWNSSKSVPKDPFPKSFEFNAEHYATLVAYPAPFHKYPEPFLCLIGISQMDLLSFIQTADPTKVRVGERQCAEDEPKLLDTTVGRVVPLLPIAHARAESELDASVDRLFDEGGSGNLAEQDDSAGDGLVVGTLLVSEATETVVEDVAHLQPKRQRKRKTVVLMLGGSFTPLLRRRLLAGAVLNPEVGIAALPTIPFITSFVSVTPERESEDQTDSMAGANLRTITAPPRPSIPLMTVATTVTSTVDPATTVKEKLLGSSVFGGDSSSGGSDHTIGGFSDLTSSDFIVGGIRTVISLDTDLQKVYVPYMMDHDQLFTEFNVGAARQMSLSAESQAQLLVKEAKAAKAIRLCAEASKFEAIEKSLQDEDEKMAEVNEKFDKLCADFVKIALHLEEKFYPHLLTTISGRRCYLKHCMKLAIAKCLISTEYLSVLGATISKAVKKGMQEGLSAGITHGSEGRKLTDVAAYNPSAEADYLSALQRLQSVKFSFIEELKTNKDASIDTIMNLLRLEDTLAERLGLTESQPNGNQLMVPIHHSSDQRVIGATALSLLLDVSNSRVQKIRENIANHISALRGVFVPLSEPLSDATLEGTPGAAPNTTTALSVTFISSSAIPPISTDDYEVAHADGQESAGVDGQAVVDENVNPFPNIDRQRSKYSRNDIFPFSMCSLSPWKMLSVMLLPIMAEKFNREKEKSEKLKELKSLLNFDGCSGTSRIRRERSRSPRQRSKEGGVFKMIGAGGRACPHAQTAIAETPFQNTQKLSQNVRIAKAGTGSQDQRGRNRVGKRMTCPNHGHVRK
ncbi:hypothetical protein Tco_0290692 [Tanacetum coccineum]